MALVLLIIIEAVSEYRYLHGESIDYAFGSTINPTQ